MTSNYFEQFKALILREPKHALPMIGNENCDYNSFLYESKNCYLCFGCSFLEDCLYVNESVSCRDSADLSFSQKSELCYDSVDLNHCYGCYFSQDLDNCSDCWFCSDCIGCTDCFGSVGLRRKKYYLFNEPLSQKSYFEKVAFYKKNLNDPQIRRDIEEKIEGLKLKTPRPHMRGVGNENVSGDHVFHSSNCTQIFDASDCQDCHYLGIETSKNKDCIDVNRTIASELCYDTISCDRSYNCNWMFIAVGNRDCDYCIFCEQCEHCFMCVNLKHKKFHILNEPYSEADYHKKVAEIKKELKREGLYGENLLYLSQEA